MYHKHFLFIAIVGVVLLAGGCRDGGQDVSFMSGSLYETVTLQAGSLTIPDTYISTVQPATKAAVAFKVGGRLVALSVDQGTSVRKGQTIAVLDGEELRVGVTSAQSMIASLETLKQSTALMMDAQISSIDQKVSQAKTALSLASLGGTGAADLQQQTAELAYQTALTEQQTTNVVLAQQEKNLYGNTKQALAQTKVFLEPLGNFLDELMGISDAKRQSNDAYEIYMSAKNTAIKSQVESEWQQLNMQYATLQPKFVQFSTSFDTMTMTTGDKAAMYEILMETETFLVRVRGLLKLTYQAIDSSVSSSSFPQTAIDGLKQTIVMYQTNLEGILLTAQGNYLLGIKGIKDGIDTFATQASMQRALLAKKVAIASKQTSLADTQLTAGADIAEQQYKEALAGLQAIKKQKQAQTDQIDAQIAQARGSLRQAQTMLGNTTLTAPIGGVVLEKMADVGQVIAPGMPVVMLADPTQGKAVIYVPESQLASFSKGKAVRIVASGLGVSLTGKVSTIAPMAEAMSKRVAVDVVFPLSGTLKLGMQVDIEVTNKVQAGLLLPQTFVVYDMGQSFVYLVTSGSQLQKTPVSIDGCQEGMCVTATFGNEIGVVVAKP